MKKLFCSVCLFLSLILLVSQPIFSEDTQNKYQSLQNEISELEAKLDELTQKKNTLASQISYMEGQVKITGLKIGQTEEQIKTLTEKIGRLEVSLDHLAILLNERIVETYKKGDIDSLILFFSSKRFPDFIARLKYLRVMQVHDRQLMLAMEEVRTNYDDQRKEEEELKAKLEKQQALLSRQKKDKEYLLTVTKNDEKNYQQILATKRAEQQALLTILAGGGEVAEVGPVKAGETIANYINGASPCSTGTHLHFEVQKDGQHQNPANYLKNTSLNFEENVAAFTPGGSWDWPISEPIRVTQEYGETFWTRLGGLWYTFHTGIDIVSGSYDSPGPRAVRAVKEGTLLRGSVSCGGGKLKYARVDQADGIQVFYVHVD